MTGTAPAALWEQGRDPAALAGFADHPPRVGFFTDTSICIGCKACEVACKEWNGVPDDGLELLGRSYDNTGRLSADSWRHVAFVEQGHAAGGAGDNGSAGTGAAGIGAAGNGAAGQAGKGGTGQSGVAPGDGRLRWLMSSDVCKHCTSAACLDVCPTGALMRTEFGTVVVQPDVCNGCGYCVPACPFGVIDQRRGDGRVWKCTLCYDRLRGGMEPACAHTCPTKSIQFGPLDELRRRAAERVEALHRSGATSARLYGADPHDGVDGMGAFFLLLDEPEVYGLPPDPVVTTRSLPARWAAAGAAALALAAAAVASFAGPRR
jgi:formate dehydrogenase iron-sulfur subunit